MILRIAQLLTGLGLGLGLLAVHGAEEPRPAVGAVHRFLPRADGGFSFDTGILRGVLRTQGKSVGLQEVTYLPSRQRLDRSMGLLGHYRVFSRGKRYGTGAWDWPSTAQSRDDGAVIVSWPAAADRPFELQATYRWRNPVTLEVETLVHAKADLPAFECFLASYFAPHFSQASVAVKSESGTNGPVEWKRADRSEGEWQVYPRDPSVVPIILDGRWMIAPNPVSWIVRSNFAIPVARRRSPNSGLSALLMAPPTECFAILTPHETEEHHSTYLSLFGVDLKEGTTARARARLAVAIAKSDAAVRVDFENAAAEWAKDP